VGEKKGAEALVGNRTEVVDYNGKGLVMPSCSNAHALGWALQTAGTPVDIKDDASKFMTKILPEAVKYARESGATTVFGQGWNLTFFGDKRPTRQELDAICSDIPIYFLDDECHKALTNTICLVNAWIMSKDGKVLKTKIRGGEIEIGTDGTPTGFLSEQAQTFVRASLDNDRLYSVDLAKSNIKQIQQHMLSSGYTMYTEGWGNYFVNTNYQDAQELDKAGEMQFNLALPYEMESWMNVDEELAKAIEAKKFASTHVHPNWIKLLVDGTVESGTGWASRNS